MPLATKSSEYIKLEKRLVLLAWINSLFGYKNNQELLLDVKEAAEGFDANGRSFIYHHLVGRGDKIKLPASDLDRYDDNIHRHLDAINRLRPEPIVLRYFQYLALLYAEIFLDLRFNRPGELLRLLNAFVQDRNSRKTAGDIPDSAFTVDDLNKLAFWMATGSGKTLIMHINYLQFLHYNKKPLDNIILITPNEGLTDQHMEEMTASSIPSERFTLSESGLGLLDPYTVRVIEITKLVEEKRGSGESVPVEAFEGNNLIFVDEGHKGSGGESWRKYRDALGQTGFTFEYSATFGQALTAARNDELTVEYGKAIGFDYSYRYFYSDGYGKDFHILNLREETTDEKTELLLLGNLLSFYEQQICFRDQSATLRTYNLDKPLWVFAGSSVNAVYTEDKQKRSDVLTVARFLHHFLENKNNGIVENIIKILSGKTGLIDAHGEDVFAGRLSYVRSQNKDAVFLYHDVLKAVFDAQAGGQLHICDIRGRTGELGLRVGGADDYFGLIYIGDTSRFKKLVEYDDSGIAVEEDVIAESLFENINSTDSSINVLIGAKKFMEGWNSWRVSNMGLLNIGRSEGSEIIQLFGRGVRLRGLGLSLKRSSAMDGQHPQYVNLLEMLNIFAIRANYMSQFREYLEREGVETDGHIQLPLAIRSNQDFLNKGLLIPELPAGKEFINECLIVLKLDSAAKVNVDLSMKVESMRSQLGLLTSVAVRTGREQVIPEQSLSLVDWSAIYIKLLEFKEEKKFSNLIITPDIPSKLFENKEKLIYHLIADDRVVRPASFSDVAALQEAVFLILCKYVEKYYYVCKERWDSNNRIYAVLDKHNLNFRDYSISIPRSEAELIAAVKKLIDEGTRIYEAENQELPTVHFDRHLYQPLLIERGGKIRSDPPGLKPSEKQFVEDMRKYVQREACKSLSTKEIFLLRNLSRGKGIGFFENEGFFPDFILWIKEGEKQCIVFIEPHGMLLEKAYGRSEKTTLHERLAVLSKTWAEKSGLPGVKLDAFVISATPYEKLKSHYGDVEWSRQDFANKHILFPDSIGDGAYLRPIFGQTFK
jgi:hypothetical protein